jgi:DNA-binding MurR/RpiR family transcriptional regulator
VSPGGERADPGRLGELRALLGSRRLTPVQRTIASVLLEHADEADYLSALQVASLAGVSQPSVTRFAVTLGFAGYGELRAAIRAILTSEREATEAPRNRFQLAVMEEARGLEALGERLGDPSRLLAAGKLLAASSPLVVLGLRASAALATYFAFYAAKVHPDVHTITFGGTSALDALAAARARGAQAVVAFCLPRWPRETVELVRAARELGLEVLLVTDSASCPATAAATELFVAEVGTALHYDSHAAAVLQAALLVEAILEADPAGAQARMEDFEDRASRGRYFA